MLKKLTALSLSLMLSLSLLSGQASAMAAPENEPPIQAEDVEGQLSPENGDAGIAPCGVVVFGPGESSGLGGGIGAGDYYGNGSPWGGGMTP